MSRQLNSLMASATVCAALASSAHAATVKVCYYAPTGNGGHTLKCKSYVNTTCADIRASWSANSGIFSSCAVTAHAIALPNPIDIGIGIGGTGGIEVHLDVDRLLTAVRYEQGMAAAASLPQPVILDPASPVYYAVLAPGETLDSLPFNGFTPFNPPIVGEAGLTLCAVNFDLTTHAVLSISVVAVDLQALTFTPVTGFCPADIGVQGGLPGHDGQTDNNDFVVFIDAFFSGDPVADRGQQGGMPGSDGRLDNNDFIVYIDQFFTAC